MRMAHMCVCTQAASEKQDAVDLSKNAGGAQSEPGEKASTAADAKLKEAAEPQTPESKPSQAEVHPCTCACAHARTHARAFASR